VSSDVVLLGVPGDGTCILFHALAARFGRPQVILEEKVSRVHLAKRRAKRVGWLAVSGQVAFAAGIAPLLGVAARRRRSEIIRAHGLDAGPIDGAVTMVPSVNSPQARRALALARPRVVVLSGTRIVSKETLASVGAPFLNLHAGITPLYRGVHGAYWALADSRPDLVGSTVHVVDSGVDTGAVVEQVLFDVTERDDFATYPLLHLAAGLPAVLRAVDAARAGTLTTREPLVRESRLRYHPTAWGYAWRRLLHGVA
jgi:phosphoribosylglycinamide formyltransferase 1